MFFFFSLHESFPLVSFRIRSSHWNVSPRPQLHPQPWRRLLFCLCRGSRNRTCVGSAYHLLPLTCVHISERVTGWHCVVKCFSICVVPQLCTVSKFFLGLFFLSLSLCGLELIYQVTQWTRRLLLNFIVCLFSTCTKAPSLKGHRPCYHIPLSFSKPWMHLGHFQHFLLHFSSSLLWSAKWDHMEQLSHFQNEDFFLCVFCFLGSEL